MNDWYGAWLEENPSNVYYNWASRGMSTPSMQNWFQNNYNRLYNQYSGLLAGGNPMGVPSFSQWLNSLNPSKYYTNNLSSAQRGYSTPTFAPRLRWLIY